MPAARGFRLLVAVLAAVSWTLPLVVAQPSAAWPGPAGASAGEMETDRSAFNPATSTTGRGLTIVEGSYVFIDNKDDPDTHSFPELLVRHGLSERFELRLGWDYEVGGGGNIVSANEGGEGSLLGTVQQESRLLYGFKVQTTEQAGIWPRSCAIVEGFTPTSGEQHATQLATTYAFGWKFPNRWRLDSALRFATASVDGFSFNRWGPSTVLRIPVTERLHSHLEYFGVFSDGRDYSAARAFISPGAKYLLRPNLELGLRVGWGITDEAAAFFSDAGVGWRF